MQQQVQELRKFVAPEIIFGTGSRHLTGKYVKNFGVSKVILVTDPGVIAAGWVDHVKQSLEKEKIQYTIYSGVTPNPRATEVMEGAEIYKRENCSAIVAVGGGSPMDCAKGIGIVSTNQQHILRFEGVDMIANPVPPMVFVPTTSGTSADVSQFAIITNLDELIKIAIVSKTIVPDVALIDPETVLTMDPYLTACTGMDALVHAIEAFVSTASSPMTDLHALEAIRLVTTYLPQVMQNQEDLAWREKVMLGSMNAGLAFSNAILGAVHAMAHSLGGLLDLPHGECNAILLDHVIDFNFDFAQERYKKIADIFKIDSRGLTPKEIKKRLMNRIHQMKSDLGITRKLQQAGVKTPDIPILAKNAHKDACLLTNPREANPRDIEVIYESAL